MCFLCTLVILINQIQAENPSHIDTSLPATSIGLYLKSLARRELGVDHLQTFLQGNAAEKKIQDDRELVHHLAERLATKLSKIQTYLTNISQELNLSLLTQNPDNNQKLLPPCCSNHPGNTVGCSVIHLGFNGTRTARLAANVFDTHTPSLPLGAVRRFFMTNDRTTHLEFPPARACGQQAYTWHRDMFVRTLHPEEKNVVILLDRCHSLSTLQLDVGRALAGFIIDSLNVNDHLALLTLDSELSFAQNQNCGIWAPASDVTKKALHLHLSSINRMSYKNYDHIMALRKAKDLMKQRPTKEKIHLFFITTANSLMSPENFVTACEAIAQDNVMIHIFLMDSNRNDEERNSKLQSVLDLLSKSCENGFKIKIKVLDSTLLLSYKIGTLFSPTSSTLSRAPLSVPWHNELERKLLLSMTQMVGEQAIVGIDVDYLYLLEDFVYNHDDHYLIVLDLQSQSVVFHPRINPREKPQLPQGIKLNQIEGDFPKELEDKIYSDKNGFFVEDGNEDNELESAFHFGSHRRKFIWKQVQDQLVIVLVKTDQGPEFVNVAAMRVSNPTKMSQVMAVYHRLDLLSPQFQAKLCLHQHTPATLETGSVFLAPYAFSGSYQHLSSNLTDKQILVFMRYLTNNNRPNPGLKPQVRHDWLQISQVLNTWKNMSFSSGMNNYIVRRFAASKSGVFFAFPGSPVPDTLDPTRQDWYLAAQQYPNRVVLSRPRLDQGGAGYVLTVSKSVQTITNDDIVNRPRDVIMGMDLTIGYINKMLLDTIPICRNLLNAGVRCFLFDHEGYLIVHPTFFDAGFDTRNGRHHLTHVEHLATTLMLNDKTLVERRRCRQLTDMTIQHSYQFNTSAGMQSLWTSSSDDDCLRYQVSLLPDTNIFLGIVLTNVTCSEEEEVTFCPCNVNGRQCMLCYDNEDSSSCECPCECPLNQCQDQSLPLCSPKPQEHEMRSDLFPMTSDMTLPPCFDTDCARHSHEEKCFGIIGCSWCQYQDQREPLGEAFCSDQAKCFGGVLGSATPYDRLEQRSRMAEGDKYFFRPTPSIAPIAGSILSAVLFLGLSAYCIRNAPKWSCLRHQGGGRRQRCGSMLQVASFEEVIEDNDNAGDEVHELGITHRNEIIVSPYRVNPGYRRPPPGTDSDHGYSTMTPMGDLDSEIVPYVDSASARSRLQRLQQRAPQSVTSGISSRTSSPIPTTATSNSSKKALTQQSSSLSSSEEASSAAASTSNVVRGATNIAVAMGRKQPNEGISLLSESSEETSSASHQQLLDPVTMLPRTNKNQFIVAATVHMVDT